MSSLRILLVEDEQLIADVYERLLERLVSAFKGATITRVSTLSAAMEILRGLAPDVTVLDLNLEDASHPATLAEISAISSKCPVVVVTGLMMPGLRERAIFEGAHSFLFKADVVKEHSLLERAVIAAMRAFKVERREGLSQEIEQLRAFELQHGSET